MAASFRIDTIVIEDEDNVVLLIAMKSSKKLEPMVTFIRFTTKLLSVLVYIVDDCLIFATYNIDSH